MGLLRAPLLRSVLRLCPSSDRHGGRAGWIPAAAGYPPRHRVGQFVGDFGLLGKLILNPICSSSVMNPDKNLVWFEMFDDESIF